MQLTLADVLCRTCLGYVHPFLDRCPGCGADRRSRLPDVLKGGALGAAAMGGDPTVTAAAVETIRRNTTLQALHGAWFRGRTQAGPDVDGVVDAAEMIDYIASGLSYRARGVPGQTAKPVDARIRVVADAVVIGAARGGDTLASVPAATILAVCPLGRDARGSRPWDGAWNGGAGPAVTPDVLRGDLLVIHAAEGIVSSFSLGSPSGLFATRPGSTHYEELARWVGLFAITRAEARWGEIGAAAHAAELGLAIPAPVGDGAPGRGVPRRPNGGPPADRPAPGEARPSSARQAMLELEDLLAGGMISQQEYQAKREEILRRL